MIKKATIIYSLNIGVLILISSVTYSQSLDFKITIQPHSSTIVVHKEKVMYYDESSWYFEDTNFDGDFKISNNLDLSTGSIFYRLNSSSICFGLILHLKNRLSFNFDLAEVRKYYYLGDYDDPKSEWRDLRGFDPLVQHFMTYNLLAEYKVLKQIRLKSDLLVGISLYKLLGQSTFDNPSEWEKQFNTYKSSTYLLNLGIQLQWNKASLKFLWRRSIGKIDNSSQPLYKVQREFNVALSYNLFSINLLSNKNKREYMNVLNVK